MSGNQYKRVNTLNDDEMDRIIILRILNYQGPTNIGPGSPGQVKNLPSKCLISGRGTPGCGI